MCRPLRRPAGRAPGDVIADKYRLCDTLGSGGMGRVYAAYHLMLDTKVALKFMHPHLLSDPVAVGRFAREARAAATLKSAHAARILDVDQLPSSELYIVMEYLEGSSLEMVAASGRGLPIADAVRHVLQACDALAEAHAQGIVHRDVKPANLFLTRGGSGPSMIKVLDFGLAKSMSAEAFVSGSPEALGTPKYMSPEQIRGARDVDARTDVWSIGVTLYELLAGRAAFDGHAASVVFERILAGAFAPLRTHRPDVSPLLASVVDRCLARDRAARFASINDVAAALRMATARTHSYVPPAPAPAAVPTHHAATLPSAGPPAPRVAAPVALPFVAPSERPVAWTHRSAVDMVDVGVGGDGDGDGPNDGPTLFQTIIAALAGPALVGAVAAGVALFVGTAHLPALGSMHAASAVAAPAVASPALSVTLGARSATLAARAKAPADDVRPLRPRASAQAAARR
jgi:tRNA A-37 threonylcarbamoyl transferase component Bud32